MSTKTAKELGCTIDPYEVLKVTLNPDGSLTRPEFPTVPPTDHGNAIPIPNETVVTKDIIINEETKTRVRIFRPTKLPSNDNKVAKLPIILYFHTGGFILYHVDTMFVNEPCGRFATEIPCIVVSVDYRLAPEHKLPAAFDDAKDAILWLQKQALDTNGDQWLRDYGDFSRCYLMGCSAGGNIAYRTALRVPELGLDTLRVVGLILNQPLFAGLKRTKSEVRLANDAILSLSVVELIWELALPAGADLDHEYSNPVIEGAYSKNITLLPRTLVRGFEGDPLLDREMEFVRMLMKRGVQITAHFGEFGFHCIDIVDAKRHLMLIKYMKDFIC